MKNFLPVLILVITVGQDIVFGRGMKQSLPRLSEVGFSKVAWLQDGKPLLTKSLAVLPIAALDKSVRHKLYRDKFEDISINATIGGAMSVTTGAYAFFFVLARPIVESPITLPEVLGITAGYTISFVFLASATKKFREAGIIKDASKMIATATANQNNIVTYKHDHRIHIGILRDTDEGLTVVDALNNETAIEPEQLQQLVVMRDGLLSNRFMGRGNLNNISPDVPKAYLHNVVAYTYQGKNHLGIVRDVSFDANGQGQIVVGNRLSGEELTITSGKRGEPVVVDADTGEQSMEKFRGVIFMRLD